MISLTILLCKPPKKSSKPTYDILISEGSQIVLDAEKVFTKVHPYADTDLYSRQGFYNPFRRLVYWWSAVTKYGISNERKTAMSYLKKVGFTCLIQRKSRDSIPFFAQDVNASAIEEVAQTYKPILSDVQERFKKAGKMNKRSSLMKYVEEKRLVEKLRIFFGKKLGRRTKAFFRDFYSCHVPYFSWKQIGPFLE